jgi:hydroxypyruvate isomerase
MEDFNRRQLLGAAASIGGAMAISSTTNGQENQKVTTAIQRVATKGNIKHSVVNWCFSKYWKANELISIAKQLGLASVELISPQHFPEIKKQGLECAIASVNIGGPPFVKGYNNPKYHELVIAATKKSIDACHEFGFKKVIAFTGFAEELSKEEGAANCVKGFKEVIGYAEKRGVTICLEHLNTRDDTHAMKGHPGYQGDDVDYCVDIIKAVGSEHLKLLFDIYHVSIMNGDIVRRIHQHAEYIGHIHTAGNPGRGELNGEQEIQYPACMQALVEIGYNGFVGHEFMPTDDPLKGLIEAVRWCDV